MRQKNNDLTRSGNNKKLIRIKPIQATPTLSGEDARSIITQAQSKPSTRSIERNERMLEIRRKIVVQK